MIGHTQLFLWSRYSDIISLLTITVRGVSNKHCLLPFYAPNFEKVGDILVSACPCVCVCIHVRDFMYGFLMEK